MRAQGVRVLIALLAAAAAILPQAPAGSAQEGVPPIMPLSELKVGMRGIGRTVVLGQRIEDFEFEVMGILQGGGGIINVKHLILFRVFGDLAKRSGGVAAGMSGSPMYIRGRMIGALSAGYIFQTPQRDVGLATPIEEMLPLLDEIKPPTSRETWPTAYRPLTPLAVGGRPVDRLVIARSTQAARAASALPGTLAFAPATTLAQVSGLSPRAFSLLQRALGDAYPRQVVQAGGSRLTLKAERIRDGSTVGVQQVRGDIDFGGICTVTLRVGNKLLICGHPWDQLGPVSYSLTAAEILAVVKTAERPFKEGNLGEMIGQIDLDRGQAIRGLLGQMPRMFAVRVTVIDADTGRRVSKGAQVVRRADLVKLFTPIVALTAADRARDQIIGEGTSRVRMTIRAGGLPNVLVRENVFYSSRDISVASMLETPLAMQFLFFNPFVQLDPMDISLEVTITSKRETAAITSVVVERREVSPGERLRARITVRPFQKDIVTSQVLDVPVPRNFPRGPAFLVVGSGGVDPVGERVDQILLSQVVAEHPPFPGESLEEGIEIFQNLGKNSHIFLQLVPFGLPAEAGEFTRFDTFAGQLIQTDWVIQGEFQVPVLIR